MLISLCMVIISQCTHMYQNIKLNTFDTHNSCQLNFSKAQKELTTLPPKEKYNSPHWSSPLGLNYNSNG